MPGPVTLTSKKHASRLYSLNAYVGNEGRIVLTEGTYYGPLGDDDGREHDEIVEVMAEDARLACAVLRQPLPGRALSRLSTGWRAKLEDTAKTIATDQILPTIEGAYRRGVFASLDGFAALLSRSESRSNARPSCGSPSHRRGASPDTGRQPQ